MSDSLQQLEHRIGHTFRDRTLLERAVTHPSYLQDHPDTLESNQRLEFLGDSVAGLVVSELLLREYPNHDEGQLSKFRAALVNTGSFAAMAVRVGLDEHLRLGKGEEKSGGRRKESILADVYEAVMGAIFLDGGYEAARRVIGDHFETLVAEVSERSTTDAKTELQELCQEICRATPVYRVVDAAGPDHAREFIVEAVIGETVLARGWGRSKRVAEQAAALDALENERATIEHIGASPAAEPEEP